MHIKICGEIQEMASKEILRHMSAETYLDIKARDPKPCLRAYCIGHEGESVGKLVGIGRVIKKWARSAVEHINEKLNIGTKIFHLHGNNTNEHEGRTAIGEVVGKTLSDIAGKLSSIAITYIFPEFKDIPLDIASVEADINLPENINPNSRAAVDVDVESITGLALGNSEITKPGFAGAKLLAILQEFSSEVQFEKPPKEGEHMTPDEIKKGIRELKLKPSDLFGSDEMSDDPVVRDVIRERRRNEEGFDKRKSIDLEAEKIKLEQTVKDLTAKLATKDQGLLKIRAADAIKPAIEKRKLDEKQTAFVLKNAAKFEPKSEESLAGDLDKFLDTQLDEFKGYAEIMGIKASETGKVGVGAGKAGDTSVEDLLKPDWQKDEIKK